MRPDDLPLVEAIADELATWEPHAPHVALAVFGTAEAPAIAAALDALCVRELGAPIAAARFVESSIGYVAGVVLADGRDVVIKATQPDVTRARLAEVVALRAGVPCSPPVLAGPVPLGAGLAILETFDERGAWADPHEPAVRRALATGLHDVIVACRPYVATSRLVSDPFAIAPDRLWPVPHSKLFDFSATPDAAWIDDVARAARGVPDAGVLVIGHADWRAEHVRLADGRVVVAYDWDSLARTLEPRLVGICAHAFVADWTQARRAQAPTLDEARAFLADYEAARGAPFTIAERATCGAVFAYSCAYTARCTQALGVDRRDEPGTFPHLVAKERERLLAL